MTKPQVIKWLKERREDVINGLLAKHKQDLIDYKQHYVLGRVTAFEREELQKAARWLYDEHDGVVKKLAAKGPDRAWITRAGDIRHIAEHGDMVQYLVERLEFKGFRPFEDLKDAQAAKLEDTQVQWEQLIAHAKTLRLRDLLAFLEGLDLTPPPDEPVTAPALPMVVFDREVLMGVK